MTPETYAALALGLLDLVERALDALSRFRGEISADTQAQVAARVAAIRSKAAFTGEHWQPDGP